MKRAFVLYLFMCFVCCLSAQSMKSNELFAKGVGLYKNGKFEEAIECFWQSKELDNRELPNNSNRKGYSDMWIASAYYKLGNIQKAIECSRYYYAPPIDRSLTIQSDSLTTIGDRYKEEGNVKKAIEKYKECAEIERRIVGENHPWYGNSLCMIGICYYEIDDNTSSAEYYNKGLSIHQKRPTFDSQHLEILRIGAVINYNAENFEKALSLAKLRVECCDKIPNLDSIDIAAAYCDYALIDYQKAKDYSNCIEFQQKGLQIYRKHLSDNDERIISEENVLIKMLNSDGQYINCAQLLDRQIKRIEILKGKKNEDYLEKLDILAALYNTGNNIDKAVSTQHQLVDAYRLFPNRKKELAIALDDLARYTTDSGSAAQAINIVEESRSLFVSICDTISSDYMSVLNTSATIYVNLLMWNKALECLSTSMHIGETYGLEDNNEYNRSLNIAVMIADKAGLEDFASRINMRLLKRQLNNENGIDSLVLATHLQNQGSILTSQGKYDDALQYQYQALTIRYRNLDYYHPDLASSFNATAHLLAKMGNYEEAITCMDHSVKILKRLGRYQTNYPIALRNRASMYLEVGNKEGVLHDIGEAILLTNRIIRNEFSYLSPLEQKHFWRDYRSFYEKNIPQYVHKLNHPVLNANAYDAMLLCKGILLNTEISLRNLLLESNDKSLLDKYDMLIETQSKLAQLYKKSNTENIQEVENLQKTIESLQRDLTTSSKVYGDYTQYMDVKMKNIQERMNEGDIAIEFMKVDVDSLTTKYMALVLTKSNTFPYLLHLCNEKQLKTYCNNPERLRDTALYNLIWSPVEKFFSTGNNIYFAPAGLLYDLSIENVVMPNGGVLSTKYNVNRLSSTREIALSHNNNKGMSSLFGNINYSASINELIEANKKNGTKTSSIVDDKENLLAYYDESSNSRSINNRYIRVAEKGINPLPGTKREISAIYPLLTNCKLHEGNDATEEHLKSLSGKTPNILHIATHGVFYTEEEQKSESLSFMQFDDSQSNVSNREDAMLLRSALLLAGASNAFFSDEVIPSNVDDGILTAQEISLLDLRGLNLVTLSACDTGRGDITGDGVFGLQRGFKKAGAQSMLMSLWKVDDEATCLLMTEFYKNWIGEKKTKHDALEAAKDVVRSHKEKGWNAPKYWASFILLDGLN